MNRRQNREKAMVCVYQYLIFPRDEKDLINDNFEQAEIQEDSYMMDVIHQAIDNRERYAGYIDNVLDDWKFDRLGAVEQALLLLGCAEFDLKQIEMNVIIDEYVRLAKTYCDGDSYKLINGVLDKI
ncbi:MAG: transcription antitermination factor NusB [Solobacterium sp.]|jgi:N utilization substance protein B|nr:transcription antitermination factor NusB [Solobacterium sp.]MCH4223180.1 transcription antitermination factor NusB [Solobacterium sp.]MCH4266028.1 transcription antitermination factor NusB [Solobacterium sp.]